MDDLVGLGGNIAAAVVACAFGELNSRWGGGGAMTTVYERSDLNERRSQRDKAIETTRFERLCSRLMVKETPSSSWCHDVLLVAVHYFQYDEYSNTITLARWQTEIHPEVNFGTALSLLMRLSLLAKAVSTVERRAQPTCGVRKI